MKKAILCLLLGLVSATSLAGVIGFDDLPGDETQAIANGYQGLDWTNLAAIRADAYPDSGYAAGTVSYANSAYNMYGQTAAISVSGGATFDVTGAFFTSAWFDQEISFEGIRAGQVLYATDIAYVLDTTTPAWIQLDWSGIDTLVIYNSSGTPWAMDDLTVTVTVPEPGSLALFSAALAGMAGMRRRRKPTPLP